jgi:hypothetical protein
MPSPTKSQVYVDPILTNISIAYQNAAYVCEKIMPLIKVAKDSGYYFVYSKAKFRPESDNRAPSTRANRVDYGLTKATYGPIMEHALEQDIPDEVVEQADNPLDPEFDATENVTERIIISKEIGLATILQDVAQITQYTTLSGTNQWSDYANSDPINDVKTARQAVQSGCLKQANTMLISQYVFDILCEHPDVIDRIKYTQFGTAAEEILARLFKVKNVIVAAAQYNTAKEGQTDSMSYIFGKHAWLLYIDPTPGIRKVSFGYTLYTKPRKVDKWYQQPEKATFVRVSDYYQQLVVAAGAAYFIQNAAA